MFAVPPRPFQESKTVGVSAQARAHVKRSVSRGPERVPQLVSAFIRSGRDDRVRWCLRRTDRSMYAESHSPRMGGPASMSEMGSNCRWLIATFMSRDILLSAVPLRSAIEPDQVCAESHYFMSRLVQPRGALTDASHLICNADIAPPPTGACSAC